MTRALVVAALTAANRWNRIDGTDTYGTYETRDGDDMVNRPGLCVAQERSPMEQALDGKRDDADDGHEYATLACTWSTTTTTTLHLKVAFFDRPADDRKTVLRASAFVVCAATSADAAGGPVESVYEGSVGWDDAAAASRSESDDDESVRVWLRDARAALTGRTADGDDSGPVYEHRLRRAGHGTRPSLILTWTMKLVPFGTMTLGSVTFVGVTAPDRHALRRASGRFVGPLIDRLAAERSFRERAASETADGARRLLEDNRRLLNQLRLLTETKQRDDQRSMARFVRVLNAKKRRLAAVQQQLSALKQQQPQRDEPVAVAEHASKTAKVWQSRGKRGRTVESDAAIDRKELADIDDSRSIMKRGQPQATRHGRERSYSISSEENKSVPLCTIDEQRKPPERVEKKRVVNVSLSPMAAVPVDNDIFAADTQIDDTVQDDSPTWFQSEQPIGPTTLVLPLKRLPTAEHNVHQKPKMMTALDKLWSGIL